MEFLIETFLLSTHMFWLRNVNEFSLCTFSPKGLDGGGGGLVFTIH